MRAIESQHLGPEDLVALAADRDAGHRPTAVRLTWELGGGSTLPFLVSFVEDSIGAVRIAVLEVFSESGDPSAGRLALELLKRDSSAAVRAAAVHTLASLGGEALLAGLGVALADPDPDVRATAVESLPAGASIESAVGEGGRSGAEHTLVLEGISAGQKRPGATRGPCRALPWVAAAFRLRPDDPIARLGRDWVDQSTLWV